MSKVTSKLRVTIPKVIADRYGIRPGSEVSFVAAGNAIRLDPHVRPGPVPSSLSRDERMKLVTEGARRRAAITQRWLELNAEAAKATEDRGWTREDLYEDRGYPGRH